MKRMESPEILRFRSLMATRQLTHPFLRAEYFQRDNEADDAGISEEDCVSNFTDLANALATCCGVTDIDTSTRRSDELAQDIGRNTRHIIVILCDGMGNAILEQHLPKTSFLRRNNQWDRLRAVWPSTTPAALTTLATARWPGQHGVPGWDLREQPGCDYPGEASGGDISQLRILAPRVMNVRTDEPANYASLDDVFLAPPWTRSTPETQRRMMYINAYNGDDFPSWYQGKTDDASRASDFSSWQTGQTQSNEPLTLSMFDVATIGETSFSTLGQPEGSEAALDYFSDGIKSAIRSICQAETEGQSSYTYLYTAHPDKHMHALGTDHPQANTLVRGINKEVERFYELLNGSRSDLLKTLDIEETIEDEELRASDRVDFAIVVTADHGHVSVLPQDMVVLPDAIIEYLEYANIGVHGKVSNDKRLYLYTHESILTLTPFPHSIP